MGKKEKEISNVEQTVMDKQIVVDYPKQLTKQQQQQQMKARYLFEKDVIQFLSQTCIKIVSTSAESEELKIVFSNSTLFCLVNYYFLKFKWLQSKIVIFIFVTKLIIILGGKIQYFLVE
eukprot:TRINITY_DN6088_c0_g1_i1.p1 TRINITY_DN6088_c0_g1~~TRINITY_DN6088_c0_g1_i1.p1  ORF type:complete len:119 (-),score=23.38 TRINITY_DN6088_c0_g1_i1:181-537(-)